MRLARALACGLLLAGCGEDRAGRGPEIRFEAESGTVALDGLPREAIAALRHEPADTWPIHFPVATAAAAGRDDRPPVLGSYAVEGDRVRFRPRFPFLPGQGYIARWLPPGAPPGTGPAAELRFSLPRPALAPSTVVSHVYPTGVELPENLLKLYVHFSAPMSRSDARHHLHLLTDDGSEVAAPFALPEVELWNEETTRLTVLLDPGRIKRGVGPNEQAGPPLVAGRLYRLRIDAEWEDAQGNPLASPFEKRFRAAPADRDAPAVESWLLEPPEHRSSPLALRLSERLDHALLLGCLTVVDSEGVAVEGTVEIPAGETSWLFRPRAPWRAGSYTLRIETRLEDLAGNSLRRPFETPVAVEAGEQDPSSGVVELPFTVKGPPASG